MSYNVHIRLGRMAIYRHRTTVSVGMEIRYQSICQRLPSGNNTFTYLLDAAVPRSLSLAWVSLYTYGRLGANWKLLGKQRD